MRKYKDVVKDRHGIFIKTTCPCCGEILIIRDDEFKRILYKPVEKLSNTIVINKILVHMIDFEHRKIHLSDEFATLNDTTQDYYQKKAFQKCFNQL